MQVTPPPPQKGTSVKKRELTPDEARAVMANDGAAVLTYVGFMVVAAAVVFAVAFLLCSCTAVEHRAIGHVGSHRRHNVDIGVGLATDWSNGARSRLLYRPQFRVEDPSSRGEPREAMAFEAEVEVPIWRAK